MNSSRFREKILFIEGGNSKRHAMNSEFYSPMPHFLAYDIKIVEEWMRWCGGYLCIALLPVLLILTIGLDLTFPFFFNCFGTHLFAILSLYLSLAKNKPPVGITNIVLFSFLTILLVLCLWLLCCCYIFLSGLVCPFSAWWTSLFIISLLTDMCSLTNLILSWLEIVDLLLAVS